MTDCRSSLQDIPTTIPTEPTVSGSCRCVGLLIRYVVRPTHLNIELVMDRTFQLFVHVVVVVVVVAVVVVVFVVVVVDVLLNAVVVVVVVLVIVVVVLFKVD